MGSLSTEQIRSFVQPGRVHRRLYTDPEIFELELARDMDGAIRLVHNQCAHRGAMVVASDGGHTDEYRCCYHGWTYHLDGRIKAAPLLHGYPADFDPKDPNAGMRRVPRVA